MSQGLETLWTLVEKKNPATRRDTNKHTQRDAKKSVGKHTDWHTCTITTQVCTESTSVPGVFVRQMSLTKTQLRTLKNKHLIGDCTTRVAIARRTLCFTFFTSRSARSGALIVLFQSHLRLVRSPTLFEILTLGVLLSNYQRRGRFRLCASGKT